MALILLFAGLFEAKAQDSSNVAVQNARWEHETALAKTAFLRNLQNSLMTEPEKVFAADTFCINYLFRLKMKETNDCSSCISQNIYSSIEKYTALLSTYNDLLMGKLSPNDKIVFRAEQASWNDYFEKHKKLAATLSKDEYTGGGEIHVNLVANEIINTIRQRLENISHFYFCQIN